MSHSNILLMDHHRSGLFDKIWFCDSDDVFFVKFFIFHQHFIDSECDENVAHLLLDQRKTNLWSHWNMCEWKSACHLKQEPSIKENYIKPFVIWCFSVFLFKWTDYFLIGDIFSTCISVFDWNTVRYQRNFLNLYKCEQSFAQQTANTSKFYWNFIAWFISFFWFYFPIVFSSIDEFRFSKGTRKIFEW